MLGIDLGERAKRSLHGIEWTLGLVPFGKLVELQARFLACRDTYPIGEGARPTHEQTATMNAIYGDLAAWGVVGWNAPRLERETVRVDYAGRSYEILSPDVIDLLLHVESTSLVADLAFAVLDVNHLTADVLTGFQ